MSSALTPLSLTLIVLVTQKSEVQLNYEFGEERLRSYRLAAWNTMHARLRLPRVHLTNLELGIIIEFPDLLERFHEIEQELGNWEAAQQQQFNSNTPMAATATPSGATQSNISRPMNTHITNHLGFNPVGVPNSDIRTTRSNPMRPSGS